ncbi:MAG: acyl carrier protein [Pseudomonadota bacterium]|jgi:acyl carrier protein|nr:acyl carrier protein [Pseudomonadota bacterium]
MPKQCPAEKELAELIVSSLNLEHLRAADLDPEAPLFGGSLGLDSIDALEIALAVSRHYGIHLRADHADNRNIFANLRALAQHIQRERHASVVEDP